jgi:hypothetical protein
MFQWQEQNPSRHLHNLFQAIKFTPPSWFCSFVHVPLMLEVIVCCTPLCSHFFLFWKEELQHGSDAQLTFIVDKLQWWEQIANFSNENALPLLCGHIPNPLRVILVFFVCCLIHGHLLIMMVVWPWPFFKLWSSFDHGPLNFLSFIFKQLSQIGNIALLWRLYVHYHMKITQGNKIFYLHLFLCLGAT